MWDLCLRRLCSTRGFSAPGLGIISGRKWVKELLMVNSMLVLPLLLRSPRCFRYKGVCVHQRGEKNRLFMVWQQLVLSFFEPGWQNPEVHKSAQKIYSHAPNTLEFDLTALGKRRKRTGRKRALNELFTCPQLLEWTSFPTAGFEWRSKIMRRGRLPTEDCHLWKLMYASFM